MTQINAVRTPIINSPYGEPEEHWLIEKGKEPERRKGRRLASYFFRVPERAARSRSAREQEEMFAEESKGEEYLLDLANLLRQRVKEWREQGYPSVTPTTRELIDLWRADDRVQPLFFAQLEAAETVIFLVEAPMHLKQGIDVPRDEPGRAAQEAGYRAFVRYALKMATGAGKTTVMGMLAAWSILNKVTDPQARAYSDTVLIICPNITIRDRLRELDPNQDDTSLYRTRELVPAHRMADLRRGEVFITNWHNLERREISEVNGQGARVVKRGKPVESVRKVRLSKSTTEADVRHQVAIGALEIISEDHTRAGRLRGFTVRETKYLESDTAFLKRILGGRKGRSSAILVINDEAHHAYRRGTGGSEEIALDEVTAAANAREATVWIEGLDRINRVLGGRGNGIRFCIDMSATPFYIQGSGNEVGRPYPWIISDYSLLEAIEGGLVKVPQLPTEDTSTDETPRYFNVWRWVQKQAQLEGHIGPVTSTEVMRYATAPIILLAGEWRRTLALWKEHFEAGSRVDNVPPVFIIVCRDTTLAKAMYEWLALGDDQYGAGIPEFRNKPGREMTVRIDSKVGEDIAAGGSKDETRRLRFVLETIGRTAWPGQRIPEEYAELIGRLNRQAHEEELSDFVTINPNVPPGRDVRCIISVSMLSEGWDATTVTHVVGLRPFGSQLLCEQVVGRALRRTCYTVDPNTNMFTEETAQIFGVPFELIPFKVEGGKPHPPTPPANHIFADPDKAEYELDFPVVEGYRDRGVVTVAVDWEQVGYLVLDSVDIPDETLVQGLSAADGRLTRYGPGKPRHLTMDEWRSSVRIQQVCFNLAKELTRQWRDEYGDSIPVHRQFPQMLQVSTTFIDEHVECEGARKKLDLLINPYFGQAVRMLLNAMSAVTDQGQNAEQAIIAAGASGVRSTANVNFYTSKDPYPVGKCHLNMGVFDLGWEVESAEQLDQHARVRAWVKNDRLGLVIPYRKDGVARKYLPDFLVELDDGDRLLIEIKGQVGDAHLKKAAAQRWCRAVNRAERFGSWTYYLCFGAEELRATLDAHSTSVQTAAFVHGTENS